MNKNCVWRGLCVAALVAGAALTAGCKDSGSTNNGNGGPIDTGGGGNTVGPSGGILKFLDGAVKMEFPAGAVAADTAISVETFSKTAPSFPATLPASRFNFGPEGLTFAKPVKVTVQYDSQDLPAGVPPSWLQLAKLTGPSWQPVTSQVDASAHTVSGEVTGFSSWAITAFPGQFKRVRLPENGLQTPALIVRDLATDLQGDTILVGDTNSLDGVTPMNGGRGAFVARYADGFKLSWVKAVDSTGNDQAWRVAVTPTGVIGVAGTTTGAFAGVAPALGTATFITTLTPDGNTRSNWPVQVDVMPSVNDGVYDLAGSPIQDFAALVAYPGAPALRVGLATYDSEGKSLGLGPVSFGAPSNIVNSGFDLGTSSIGTFVLTQTWALSTPVPEWTGWAVAGFDDSGAAKKGYPLHQGEVETGMPQAMAVDDQSNVFVAAFTDDTLSRIRISSFTPDGKPRSGWPAEFDVGEDTNVKSMAIDPLGNIYLAGKTGGSLGGTNAGGTDIYVTSYNPAGQLRNNWPVQFGTAGDDVVVRMTVNGQGQVVLTGRLDEVGSATPEGADYFVARLWLR